MDIHTEMLLNEYDAHVEVFNKIYEIVLKNLNEFTVSLHMLVNSVEGRVKTRKSLEGKLLLKGHKYKTLSDITDLVGARVVTFYQNEVDLIGAKITKTFDIDWENSIDRRKNYRIDQFGYLSVHYICKIPKSMYYDEKHPEINEYRFEIQLRTVLQHAWATITHDTGYKNDVEVPSEYLRQLNRLAGILELADIEFQEIHDSVFEYRRKVKQIIKSGDLSKVELNGDSYKAYLESGAFTQLNERIAKINNMEIEERPLTVFLKLFKLLEMETLKDLDDCLKNYGELAYQLSVHLFEGTDIDIMSSTTGPLALCVVYGVSKGGQVETIKFAIDMLNGERKSNLAFAKRLYDICTDIGIVKE